MVVSESPTPGGLAGSIEFIRLEETLREFAEGQRFIYVPNPGNWGDGLIRYATERFLNRHSFSYVRLAASKAFSAKRETFETMLSSDKVRIVYGGGGAFFRKYGMHKVLPAMVTESDRVLVLPSTFAVPARKLGFRRNDILFRRDNAESSQFAGRSIFCHDMALSLGIIPTSVQGSSTGYFFRKDVEKVSWINIPPDNRDISGERKEHHPMSDFLDGIARFEIVHTNRLHVAIAAAMMCRRVHFYSNSYFKNRAVFEASLKNNFPNISFHQEGEVT